jgi:hypothetical protein
MRWVVGWLLVAAAVLKAAQLVSEPAIVLTSPLGGSFLPVQVGIEFGFGLLVLSGNYWQQVRWVAVLLFTGFAAYSLSLALGGAASCGCFGPLKIHPWWTFALDGAVVAGLLFSIRHWRTEDQATDRQWHTSLIRRRAISAAILGASGLCVALLVRYADTRTASADDLLSEAGGLVIVEPEKWIGKPLPFTDWIDLDLSTGDWIVFLHRHDCPACQEALPRYEELALQSTSERVAIVEVPPYGDSTPYNDETHARLNNARDWFVQTPVEIRLSDGVITASSTELPQLVSH